MYHCIAKNLNTLLLDRGQFGDNIADAKADMRALIYALTALIDLQILVG